MKPISQRNARLEALAPNRTPHGTRRRRITRTLLALIAIVPLLLDVIVRLSSADHIITAGQAAEFDADCILVLGARVYEDGSPSGVLEDRLITAVGAYESGASDRLLMSGDHGRVDYDEVNVMKRYAVESGVPSEHVFMDHAGFSTYESIYRARDVFKARRVLIVTQRYHLYRALYIAKRMGLEAYGLAADIRNYSGQTRFELREVLARDKDFLLTLFMPAPTYLGQAIPVFGNGDRTNDQYGIFIDHPATAW